MARIASLSVLLTTTGNDFLAEKYGEVIANVQKDTMAQRIKNKSLSGDPTTGTVEAKRFENTASSNYGTARAAGAGTKLKAEPVTISINKDKELVNEIEEKDVKLYGVDAVISKKAAMDKKSMERELEKAFWAEAVNAGTKVTLTATDIQEQMEELIQKLETVSNNYVDGVPRDMIKLVLAPSEYGKIRTYLDKVELDGQKEAVTMYHGVEVESSVYLPSGTKGVCICDEAIAQPILPTVMPAEKIQLSNAYAFGMFYSYGTKAVTPDLIFHI